MRTKDWILRKVRQRGSTTTPEVVEQMGISRQTAAQHFRELIAQNKLVKVHSTRKARYFSPRRGSRKFGFQEKLFSSRYSIRGLSEDRVFQEAVLRMGLARLLSPSAYRIVGYAFTEMLNNAIDHSQSRDAQIRLACGQGILEFQVADRGIGVFESVRRKFKLKDHFEAVEHLLKGKQTSDPQRHSGQGIFFTSKIADRFILESARLSLLIDNVAGDVALKDIRPFRGTRVVFRLNPKSRKDLKKLFNEYSNSRYEFDRTRIVVHLSERPGEYLSRSQAKRLLFGLEKFKRLVLDFKRVDGIGQGFADEIFRVFQRAHPRIRIEVAHLSSSVEYMIRRAKNA